MKSFRNRILLAMGVVATALTGSISTTAQSQDSRPQVCDVPTRTITLFAEELSNGRVGYGLTPETAKVPGPTIEMVEGECVAIRLTNRTGRRVSFHPHGVAYTVRSDGTPLNRSCVQPSRTRTYVVEAVPQQARTDGTINPGTAGYWNYHDHCRGGPHGTDGIRSGLFGALVVRRAGDPIPDKRFVAVMSGVHFNLRRAPNTPVFKANQGQRVEFVIITHGDALHSFHLHGHRWADTRTGMADAMSEDPTVIDNKTSGPGDSFGFQIVAGEDSGPGAWMYHCHVQSHSDLGMSGIFLVRNPDGTVPSHARRALDKWRHGAH